MGIKNLSKVFAATKLVKWEALRGQTVAIDMKVMLYRGLRGGKSIHQLTDKYGNPTMALKMLWSNVLKLQRLGIKQIWCFDHDTRKTKVNEFHNPEKLKEILKRRKAKETAQKKLDEIKDIIKKKANDISFKKRSVLSDSDDDIDPADVKPISPAELEHSMHQYEKQTVSATEAMCDEFRFVLNCLNIRHVEAPAGYEAEQIATILCQNGIADSVISTDMDVIIFGAPVFYRIKPHDKTGKLHKYVLEDIFKQITKKTSEFEPSLKTLRRIAVVLGSDFAAKTPGVGPGRLFKLLGEIELTKEQKKARKLFRKQLKKPLKISNDEKEAFTDTNYDLLITWMVDERSFNRKLTTNNLAVVMNMEKGKSWPADLNMKKLSKVAADLPPKKK